MQSSVSCNSESRQQKSDQLTNAEDDLRFSGSSLSTYAHLFHWHGPYIDDLPKVPTYSARAHHKSSLHVSSLIRIDDQPKVVINILDTRGDLGLHCLYLPKVPFLCDLLMQTNRGFVKEEYLMVNLA